MRANFLENSSDCCIIAASWMWSKLSITAIFFFFQVEGWNIFFSLPPPPPPPLPPPPPPPLPPPLALFIAGLSRGYARFFFFVLRTKKRNNPLKRKRERDAAHFPICRGGKEGVEMQRRRRYGEEHVGKFFFCNMLLPYVVVVIENMDGGATPLSLKKKVKKKEGLAIYGRPKHLESEHCCNIFCHWTYLESFFFCYQV